MFHQYVSAVLAFTIISLSVCAPTANAQDPGKTSSTLANSDEEIIYRANFGRADDVELLIKNGANPNAKNEQGWSVLAIASDRVDPEAAKIVAVLLKAGANPNVFDAATKNYPILNAVKNDSAEIVKLLIEAGADYKVKDASGRSLIEYAKARGKKEVITPIQAKIDAEAAAAAALRSPDRFKKLAYDYGYSSCAFQYYVFFQQSGQNPEKNKETAALIEKYKANLSYDANEMRKYFPYVDKKFYDGITTPAMQIITDQLNKMVSNGVRRSKGVGKPGDMEKRCSDIMKKVKITVPDKLQ